MGKVFDFKQWPKEFKSDKRWGVDEVSKIGTWYKENHFISEEEASLAVIQWPLFHMKVKNQ